MFVFEAWVEGDVGVDVAAEEFSGLEVGIAVDGGGNEPFLVDVEAEEGVGVGTLVAVVGQDAVEDECGSAIDFALSGEGEFQIAVFVPQFRVFEDEFETTPEAELVDGASCGGFGAFAVDGLLDFRDDDFDQPAVGFDPCEGLAVIVGPCAFDVEGAVGFLGVVDPFHVDAEGLLAKLDGDDLRGGEAVLDAFLLGEGAGVAFDAGVFVMIEGVLEELDGVFVGAAVSF